MVLKKIFLLIPFIIGNSIPPGSFGQSMGATSISNGSVVDPLSAEGFRYNQFRKANDGMNNKLNNFILPVDTLPTPSFINLNNKIKMKSRGLRKISPIYTFKSPN